MNNVVHVNFAERRLATDLARERLYASLEQLARLRRMGVRGLLDGYESPEDEPKTIPKATAARRLDGSPRLRSLHSG